MSKTKSTSLQTVKTAPNTTVIYDAKDTSQQTQDFMTDLGNYFESLNVSKDVRETTTSFYLGLLGMERNLFELGIKQVMNQIETGAENIDNPLLGGFLGDLGYLEYYAPSLYDYFNDMFGENKTLDRSEVLTNLGIEKDPSDVSEGPILTEAPSLGAPPVFTAGSQRITDPVGSVGTAEDSFLNEDFISETFENRRYSDATPEEIQAIVDSVEEEWGDSWDRLSDQSKELEITGRINDYVRDNTVNIKDLYRIFQAELGRRPTTEEINDILGGTKGIIKSTEEDIIGRISTPEVERPEGTVNLEELSEEQVGTFWPEIQESLEGLGDAVKQAVFGTSGVPKTPEELLEAIETGVMEGLKGPIAVTFDPEVGVTLDLKIPVGFEINGNSIQLPIFDKDGNFVLGQSIVDEAGRIYQEIGGTLQEIGNIFTDNEGNVFLDIIDAGQVALGQLGISEEGLLTGVLVEAAIGDFQYDPGTGEIIEEVQASVDDLGLDEGEEDGLADTVGEETDVPPSVDPDDSQDGLGLTDENDIEELILTEAPSLGAPPVFTADSQRIVDPIGSVGSTTEVYSNDEDDTRQEESVEIPLDTIKETELTEDTVVITDGDDSGDTDEQPPLTGGDDSGDTDEQPPLTGGDDSGDTDEQPPLTGGDDSGDTDEQPPLTGGDDSGDTDEQPPLTSEPIIDDDVQEEPPLVGPPGTDGVDGVDGAAGAAGAPGSRGGYMGGLSYQLPQFVGVQYQPKDYTVELNRIINESLFKGMI